MREASSLRWMDTGKVEPSITSYCAQNLKVGKEYVFRVMAENEVGKSEPLTSDSVSPKSPFGKL